MKSLNHLHVVRVIVSLLLSDLIVRRATWPLFMVGLIGLAGGNRTYADVVYFTTVTGVYQVTAGGTPSVFVAATGDGQTGNHLNQPLGLAIDSGGNLYVSNVNNGDIVKIAPDATTRIFSHTDTTSFLYAGLAIDKNGNIYAAERNNGKVDKITPSGAVSTLAAGLTQPGLLAVDGHGTVYSSNGNNTISKITSGGVVSPFANVGGGVAVDAGGNVYVGTGQDILKFAPDGTSTTFAPGLQVGNMAFGPDGSLYAEDYGSNTLYVIDPAGASKPFAFDVVNPGPFAVRSTPEPSVWTAAIGMVLVALMCGR